MYRSNRSRKQCTFYLFIMRLAMASRTDADEDCLSHSNRCVMVLLLIFVSGFCTSGGHTVGLILSRDYF